MLVLFFITKARTDASRPDENSPMEMTVSDLSIVSGQDQWNRFKELCNKNIEASIIINESFSSEEYGGDFSVKIEYDGNNYSVLNDESDEQSYKYLQELTGTPSGTTGQVTHVILTNQKIVFDDIENSIFSNDSNDKINYYQIMILK